MDHKKNFRRGRPIGAIQSTNQEVSAFFMLCDKLNLSLQDINAALAEAVQKPPHYRTLQEWRRGKHEPRFAPLAAWAKIVRQYARKRKEI